ncbi:MAB_1171c family putative transporter [Streptomyces sp. NPDC050485]|uniref:MAB_1171c family putative transporter n=1 Tax=Streptomyces sp. NPDC050485 TaxID=3365617 RepID=UPI0037B39572
MSELHPICLVIASMGFLFLLRDLKNNRKDRALVLLSLVYLSSALSFITELPPIWGRIDAALGVTNIAVPLAQSFVMLILVFQTSVVAYWAFPPAKARRMSKIFWIAGAAAIAGLFATFSQIDPDDFSHFLVRGPFYKAYLGIYIAAYTLAQTYLAVKCWQQARRSANAWVSASLRIITVGAVITVGQSVIRTADLVADAFGSSADSWLAFAWLCGDAGALLTLLGYFLPTLVDRARGVYGWANEHYVYKRLGPLWEALYAATPSIAAVPAESQLRSLVQLRPISFSLYRRITEIRDGMIELRPYLNADVRDEAEHRHGTQGLKDPDLAAAVVAEQIREALASHRQKQAADEVTEYADARVSPETTDEDKHLLLRIARHFTPPLAQVTTPAHS